MPRRAGCRYETGSIMREQLELVKTEKELKEMIQKINSQLNQLLVEEFQLKSNDIDEEILKPSQKKISEPQAVLPAIDIDDKIAINKLELKLDQVVGTLMEEEEDDD